MHNGRCTNIERMGKYAWRSIYDDMLGVGDSVSRRELLVIADRTLWTKPTSSLSVICGACSICVYGSYNYFYLLSISYTSSALHASRELGH